MVPISVEIPSIDAIPREKLRCNSGMTTDRYAADQSVDRRVWRDLDLALRTAASLQTSIRHADAKAAVVIGIQGGLATATAECAPSLLHTPGRVAPVIAGMLAVMVLVGLAVTACYAGLALTPRLAGPPKANRFAFPTIAAANRPLGLADARRLRREAWDLVSTLAGIAMTKHQHVRRSFLGLAATTSTAGALQILAAFVTPVA